MSAAAEAPPPPAAGQPGVGTVLGPFRLTMLLGQGALGDVFAAEPLDHASKTKALVRVLAPGVASRPELREPIGRDLAVLRTIDHPGVARLLTIGEQAGHVFYALEDPGRLSLSDLVRKGRPLDERELVWVAAGLAAGLAALHKAGLPHGGVAAHAAFLGPGGPVLADLAWTVRLREQSGIIEPGEGPAPSLPHDLRSFGNTLIHAATGALPTDPGARRLPPGTSARIGGLVDLLVGPADKRPTAEKAARLLAQMAKELQVERCPSSLVGLIEQLALGGAGLLESASPDAAQGPPLGKFGRYVLLEEVGRGGMGVVYKARHADFERFFALKVMLAGWLADETSRRRFLHEAEAAAGLDHPAIVRVHDCGVVEGRPYIAMDLTPGRSLTEVCKDRSVTLDQLLGLFVETVRGVHYAHSRGIIHRDLKPENVIVDPQGHPHILDFGVAKRVGEASGMLTVAGELVGTPAYMPPEQAEGRGNDIDTRSDVYSLGASLFEVVTRGRLPFEGKTVTDILTRILLEEPAVPSALAPELPWEVDAIVLKAMEKRRERRYQSAAELAEDLQRYLRGIPVHARQTTLGYRVKKWLARRWPAVAGVAATALVAVAAGAGVIASRRAEVRKLVEEGDEALARKDPRDALERYAQALALDATHLGASLGRERSLAQVDEAERAARAAQARERAARLTAAAEAHEQAGRHEDARAAFEQALAFPGAPAAAQDGLVRVKLLLAAREDETRRAALVAHDVGRAGQHEAAAEEHRKAGKLRDAQAELLKAIAFGSPSASRTLGEVEEALLAERMAQVQEEVRRRGVEEAKRLATDGTAALDRDDLEGARKAFVQALGFDATCQAAQDGLVEVARLARSVEAREERAGLMRRAAEQLRLARESVDRGRELFRTGDDPDAVREAYVQALEAFDRALFVAPDHAEARAGKAAAAREVAVILRDEGHYDLADFILRIGGAAQDGPAAEPELPSDPHLVVLEGDKVNIRRAFGGVVRFTPTRVDAFDRLRAQVRGRSGGRFRVVIQVRSEATASVPPLVHAKALWIRVEDRVAKTQSRTEKVEFQGAFMRQVTVDARGRIVAPFERARDLPAQRFVQEAVDVANRLLAEMEQKAR